MDECGMSYVYKNQAQMDSKFLKNQFLRFLSQIKTTLKEHFIQKWTIEIAESSKCFYYRHFQLKPEFQNYLKKRPQIFRFR